MNFKTKYIFGIFIFVMFMFQSLDIDAQRRGRSDSRSRTQESVPVKDKLWYGLGIGNLGIGGNSFGFSMKGFAGYKFLNDVSGGLTGKFFYDSFTGNQSLFSYGMGAFARARVFNGVFVHGEYNLTSYDATNRETFSYPMIGGGYSSGSGPWTGGILILLNLDQDVRDLGTSDYVEYWINFNYNLFSE